MFAFYFGDIRITIHVFTAVNGMWKHKTWACDKEPSISRRVWLCVHNTVDFSSQVSLCNLLPPPRLTHLAPGLLRNFAVRRGIRDKDALADLMMA